MNIRNYIDSGILQNYALGLTSPAEVATLEKLLPLYPDLQDALWDWEMKLEQYAIQHQTPPPEGTWELIADRIRELPATRPAYGQNGHSNGQETKEKEEEYLSVKHHSSTIRVHKYWRPAFIIIFILSKIFLALSIYYYLQYKHTQKDIQSLQQQLPKANGPVQAAGK